MRVNGIDFSIGADPELFIRKKSQKKYFWNADGVIPGDKENPYRVRHGAIQVDGMAVEFNIDPVLTKEQFIRNIKAVVKNLKDRVEAQGFKLCPVPVAYFTKELYDKASDKSKELGCNPDWDAYTGRQTPTPVPPKEIFRTGAGHIHIGWGSGFKVDDPALIDACCHLAKHLDATVGTEIAHSSADNIKRTKLYGKLGCFRPTTYGMEYRTPSNSWLTSLEGVSWIWDRVELALHNSFKPNGYSPRIIEKGKSFYEIP